MATFVCGVCESEFVDNILGASSLERAHAERCPGPKKIEPPLVFEPRDPEGNPRALAGTWRPPFGDVFRLNDPVGGMLWYHEAGWRRRWQSGEFDRPLYRGD